MVILFITTHLPPTHLRQAADPLVRAATALKPTFIAGLYQACALEGPEELALVVGMVWRKRDFIGMVWGKRDFIGMVWENEIFWDCMEVCFYWDSMEKRK